MSSRRRIPDWLALAVLALGAVPTLLALAARWHWACDNLTSWPLHYAACGLLAGGLWLWSRRFWAALAAGVLIGWNLWIVWPAAPDTAVAPFTATSLAGKPLRLVAANVKASNRDFGRFAAMVEQADADIVLVLEVDAAWGAALEPLRRRYPHGRTVVRADNFGIALLSRVPLDGVEVVDFGGSDKPTLVAQVTHQGVTHRGRPLTLFGTHPVPPMGRRLAASRNRQFAALAGRIRQTTGPCVLLGDLNCCPWSPYFRDLLHTSGLRDSRAGHGWGATWPTFFPPALMPLDHALLSPGLTVTQRSVLPSIGSDHRPILLDIVP